MRAEEPHFISLYRVVERKKMLCPVLGFAVKAFNRAREIILVHRPEPFAM